MQFGRTLLIYFLLTITLITLALSIIGSNVSLAALWQFITIGCIFALLPVLHLVFEYWTIQKYFDHIHKLNEQQHTIQANNIDKLNQRFETMTIEFKTRLDSLKADKTYIERRLHDFVEVELALLPNGISDDVKLSNEAANLLNLVQQRQKNLAREMNFVQLQKESQIREVYLSELFADIDKVWVAIGAINEETGHSNHVDLLYVSAIARYLQCKNLFEFGTYIGRTSYHLTYASENAIVYTLNLPPEQDARVAPYLGTYFHNSDREPFIKQIFGDSREFDTTPYRQKMDLIFVDGDHSYELVKNDTTKAFEMLAPGGVIIWHDYAAKSPGVVKFFKEFTQSQPVFRIKNTCLLLHIDGIAPMTFTPHAMRPSLMSKANLANQN